MKKILLLVFLLLCIAGPASAYCVYLDCPATIQAGQQLKCSVDSNFPPGTTFNLALYQAGYTSTLIKSIPVTIQADKKTQYINYDTTGFPGGVYKAELTYSSAIEPCSDSKESLQVEIIDRSADVEITAPLTQSLDNALRVEGKLKNGGNNGVEIEVSGPDGRIFGPQWIGTKNNIQDGAGIFTQKVTVKSGGEYSVEFTDSKGFVTTKTFTVTAPTVATTAVPMTTVAPVRTKTTMTTAPTPWPTTTAQSPLSPLSGVCGLAGAGLLVILIIKRGK